MSRLKKYTTFKIASDPERILSLREFVELSSQERSALPTPLRFLGNGSNTLIDDQGLKGSVILTREPEANEPKILEEIGDHVVVKVEAGSFLPSIARWSQKQGLTGCEYMIGIPGTLGGAVVLNAGANDQELKDIALEVEVFDLSAHKFKIISKRDCQFDYRSSLFENGGFVILAAHLRLKKSDPLAIQELIDRNLEYRKQKTPYAKPSWGSTFTRLKKSDGSWLYPGQVVEALGFKGYQVGQVQVSEVHANYLVNLGGAKFDDALQIIIEIEAAAQQKLGINMKREVQIWSDRSV